LENLDVFPHPSVGFHSVDYHLRLFASIDLVGSTAFKQKSMREPFDSIGSSRWRDITLKFYRDAANRFDEYWRQCKVSSSPNLLLDGLGHSGPKVWKILGDEIIFVSHISSVSDFSQITESFVETVASLARQRPAPDLDVKGTMWVAEFPGLNARVSLRAEADDEDASGDDEHSAETDYLGPAIDLGFRLCKFASPGIVPIDIQTALFLSEEGTAPSLAERFIYLGRHTLKGIDRDRPYPVLAIDTDENGGARELERLEADLDGRVRRPARWAVHSFCKEYLLKHFTRKLPYLSGSGVSQTPPTWMEDWRRDIQARREREAAEDAPLAMMADASAVDLTASAVPLTARTILHGLKTPGP
jgi:hypothetical protein